MRTLLSTLALLAIVAPAYANELDRDPEGSIPQSNTVANEPAATNDASSMSRMEPAAGPVTSPAAGTETHKTHKKHTGHVTSKPKTQPAATPKDTVNHSDSEGTTDRSRAIE